MTGKNKRSPARNAAKSIRSRTIFPSCSSTTSRRNMADVLNDNRLNRLIEEAIMEDLGMGDVTTEAIVPDDATGEGEIRVKERGIVARLSVATLVFHCVGPETSLKI